jgi:hypothetical protein
LEHPTHVFRANNERGRYKASELSLLFLTKRKKEKLKDCH